MLTISNKAVKSKVLDTFITDRDYMKNSYTITELMLELGINSRATFWRRRKKGDIPPPDLNHGHPIWMRKTLAHLLPSLTTNP
jgi:hypothetical protein